MVNCITTIIDIVSGHNTGIILKVRNNSLNVDLEGKMEKSLFKPLTPAQIKNEKKKSNAVFQSRQELAKVIYQMKPWEYVVVPSDIRIIPEEYRWSENFKKKADYKKLITVPREEAMERRLRPQDSVETKLSSYDGKERGYGWVGNRNNTLRLVPLVVAYDGIELLLNAKDEIKVDRYASNARFSVPARKTDKNYEGDLLTIPFGDVKDYERAKTKYADWIDLDWRCSCEDNSFMGNLNTNRVIPETRACAHSVAAYKKLKQQQVSKRNPVSIDPFAFPKKAAHELVQKMRNNVIRVYQNGNDAETKRNLLIGEQEVLLSIAASELGFKNLYFFDNSTRGISYCEVYIGPK
ncbi:MAG: hypothetical protein Q8O89_07655 [Nanoarchaeota archaeon]|nr:hypothetical protein [Nanoarchaeota archaeon]